MDTRSEMIQEVVHRGPAQWADVLERALDRSQTWWPIVVVYDSPEVAGYSWFDDSVAAIRFAHAFNEPPESFAHIVPVGHLTHFPASRIAALEAQKEKWEVPLG